MIEWMQRHRKYLVVTIWISTIAFVGAGSVGFGAYSYGKINSSVAKVGDRYISNKDYQNALANAKSYYKNMLGDSFTEESAKQMGLENGVLQELVNRALMLNYADELGFYVLDEDIKNEIANNKIFQKDGLFNITQYKRVLANIRISPREYEDSLKSDILLKKLTNTLAIPANKELTTLISSAMFMRDRLSIGSIDADTNSIKIDNEKLKKFWEPIKNQFKSKKTYDVKVDFFSLNDVKVEDLELKKFYEENRYKFKDTSGKLKSFEKAKDDVVTALKFKKLRQNAKVRSVKIKKGKIKPAKKLTIDSDDTNYPIKQLATANPNSVLKPFKQKDGYVVIKLIKTNLPKALSFEEAKGFVKPLYERDLTTKTLTKMAKKALKTFKGEDVGFVSKETNATLAKLTPSQTNALISKVFSTNASKGYVIVDNKAILYKILEQKLLDKNLEQKHNAQLTSVALSLQNNSVSSGLLEKLSKRYEIKLFAKGN